MPYCIHCGALNPDVAKFCSSCGKPFATSSVQAAPQQQQTAQQLAQQALTTQSSVPQQQNINSIRPVQAPATNRSISIAKTATHPATGGALLVLIGFFLPWAAGYYDYYTSYSMNGFTFAKQFMAQSTLYGDEGVKVIGTLIGISLYIIVAAAGFFLLSSILDPGINGLARLVRFVPFLVFAAIILLIIIASAATKQTMGSLSGMKIGLYMCFVGSFLMLFLNRRA